MREDAIAPMIKQIHDALLKKANNDLRGENMTLTQMAFLTGLCSLPDHEMTLKQLEEVHHVSQPTAHGVVKRLLEKKLVETFDDRKNHRIKHVRITQEGIRKCENGRRYMTEAETMLTRNLSERDQKNLKDLLQRVVEGLS